MQPRRLEVGTVQCLLELGSKELLYVFVLGYHSGSAMPQGPLVLKASPPMTHQLCGFGECGVFGILYVKLAN